MTKEILSAIQVVVAFGLINVWVFRFNRASAFRGGSAKTMLEEFAAYGLPPWSTYCVGFLKVGAALALIAGLWFPLIVFPASLLIAALMVGALAMHIKIGDPLMKSIPAFMLLILSVAICLSTQHV